MCWMVEFRVKSPPDSKSVVRRMKSNQTLSRSPMLSFSIPRTTSFGCANGHSESSSCVSLTMRSWSWSTTRAQWVADEGTELVRMLTSEPATSTPIVPNRSEEHTSELQSHLNLVCRLLLEKKKKKKTRIIKTKKKKKKKKIKKKTKKK